MKKTVGISVFVIVLALVVALFLLRDYLTFENLKLYKNSILDFTSANYFLTSVLFFITSVIWINSPIPLTLVMSVACGLLFGVTYGIFYNIIAVSIGSSAGFWLVRYSFHDSLQNRYFKLVEKANNEVEKDGFSYFLALRAAFICPYFLINILGGLSKINYKKFLLSTVIGAIPEAIVYSYSGSIISKINSPHDLFGWKSVTAILLIVTLSLAPVWTRAYKKFTS